MLEVVEAVRFDRAMATGKTRPVLLACERPTGEEVEVVAKFSYGCNNSPEALVREAIAGCFAVSLGLPMPEPFLVRVDEEFINTIPDAAVAEYLRKSIPIGFGTRKLPEGFNVWSTKAKLANGLMQQAIEIMAFDAFVTNADRRPENPNLLCDGRSFAIFDHEMAFMAELNMFWSAPWIAGALNPPYSPKAHILFASLTQPVDVDLQRFVDSLVSINDDQISAYAQALPAEWVGDPAAAQRAVTLIRDLRDNAADAVNEFKRALV